MAKKVFSGLVTAWRLAGWPTSDSPSAVKATIEGVVRAPSAFSITLGFLPSMTATQEFVVPRSIPITFAINYLLRLASFDIPYPGNAIGPNMGPASVNSIPEFWPVSKPITRRSRAI
jgi:hypothetical protein